MSKNLLIGRKAELKILEKEIFLRKPDRAHITRTRSLTGPMGIGKHRLLEEAIAQFEQAGHPGVYLFSQDLRQSGTMAVLLKNYAIDFRSIITEEVLIRAPESDASQTKRILEAYDWFEQNQNVIVENPQNYSIESHAKAHFMELLDAFTEVGLHTILLLDSFDSIIDFYPDMKHQSLPNFLFSLTPKASFVRPRSLSVLLISERMPRFLVKKDGSIFEPAYDPIVLKNFNEEEMDEFFHSFSDLPCGIPNKTLRAEILACVGRFPDTLMILRHQIEEKKYYSQEIIPIRSLIPDRSSLFHHLCTLMRSQWVDDYSHNLNTHLYAIDVLKRYFIDKESDTQINQLYSFGLVDKTTSGKYTPLTDYATEQYSSEDSEFLTYVRNGRYPTSAEPISTHENGKSIGVKCAWLHLSDLHVLPQARTTLILEHYKRLADHIEAKPEFLVITGDFRHKKRKTQFANSESFLQQILDIFNIDRKDVFLIPGNHDVGTIPPDALESTRSDIIQKICDNIDNESFYKEHIRFLQDSFSEYDEFARNFYLGSGVDDERIVHPSRVCCIPWNNMLNLLCVNTALISDGSEHPEILDIDALYSCNIPLDYPIIMLGHHGLNDLSIAQQKMIRAFIQEKNVCAYLHGDIHKHREEPIYRISRSSNPTKFAWGIACGKSAPEAGDRYSDVGVVYYRWQTDDHVIMDRYSWLPETGFYPDKRFEGLSESRFFSMR